MKRSPLFLAFVGIAALVSQACNSPVLNHANAAQSPPAQTPHGDKGCPLAFTEHGVCASITWDKPPVEGDENTGKLRFWSLDKGTEHGPYIDPPHTVFMKTWMPSMGHGSSPVTTVHSKDASGAPVPGVFEFSKVYFIMPGEWEMHVQLKNGSSVHEEAIEKIKI